jgi:hypothetical protein
MFCAMQLNFRDVPGESASGSFSSLQLRRPSLHAVRRLHKHAHSQYLKLSQQVSRRYVYLRQPLQWTPKHVKLRDKFSFVLGISHLTVSAYWLGWSPSTFYRLYTAKAVLLFTLRAVLYRRAKMHYYLWDFCYYANALMLLHIWALPEACELQRILFAFSMGPLAWTIILFRNSMIFHSLDKVMPSNLSAHSMIGFVVAGSLCSPTPTRSCCFTPGPCQRRVSSSASYLRFLRGPLPGRSPSSATR